MNKNIKNFCILCAIIAIFALYFWLKPHKIDTFQDAKEILESSIYYDHHKTIYCNVEFDDYKNIKLPAQLALTGKRAAKMEWEHAVPAAQFGLGFSEWTKGHPECRKNGKSYAGRKCAAQTSSQYRQMENDMYNLFPAIGAINASRGDKAYAELPDVEPKSAYCQVKIDKRHFEPPDMAKGQLARAALYRDWRYDKFKLGAAQKNLFKVWDNSFAVDSWECLRAKRIEKIQGNENPFVKRKCQLFNLW